MFLCTYWLMYCLMDLGFLAVFIFLVKCFQYWVKVCSFYYHYQYWLLFIVIDCFFVLIVVFFCDSFFVIYCFMFIYRFSGHSDGVIPGLVSIPEVKSVTFCLVLWRYLWEFHFAASLFFILFCITLLYYFIFLKHVIILFFYYIFNIITLSNFYILVYILIYFYISF